MARPKRPAQTSEPSEGESLRRYKRPRFDSTLQAARLRNNDPVIAEMESTRLRRPVPVATLPDAGNPVESNGTAETHADETNADEIKFDAVNVIVVIPVLKLRGYHGTSRAYSQNLKLQLMRIAAEIREKIFEYALIHSKGILFDFHRFYTTNLPGVDYFGGHRKEHTSWDVAGHFLGSDTPKKDREMAVALLRVSKQAYYEAYPILYKQNKFSATHARAFARLFAEYPTTRITPKPRTDLIRDLSIWPTASGIPDYLPYLLFPHLIKHFPALQHLQVTFDVAVRDLGGDYSNGINPLDLDIVKQAALLTKAHPILKRAIWNKNSGTSFYPQKYNRYALMIIDFVPAGLDTPKDFAIMDAGRVGPKLQEKVDWFPTKSLILNSPLIRATDRKNIAVHNLVAFAREDGSPSSEAE